VQGTDPREVEEDEDNTTADVKQCRTFDASSGAWSGDQCPHDGVIDQDIYGDLIHQTSILYKYAQSRLDESSLTTQEAMVSCQFVSSSN